MSDAQIAQVWHTIVAWAQAILGVGGGGGVLLAWWLKRKKDGKSPGTFRIWQTLDHHIQEDDRRFSQLDDRITNNHLELLNRLGDVREGIVEIKGYLKGAGHDHL